MAVAESDRYFSLVKVFSSRTMMVENGALWGTGFPVVRLLDGGESRHPLLNLCCRSWCVQREFVFVLSMPLSVLASLTAPTLSAGRMPGWDRWRRSGHGVDRRVRPSRARSKKSWGRQAHGRIMARTMTERVRLIGSSGITKSRSTPKGSRFETTLTIAPNKPRANQYSNVILPETEVGNVGPTRPHRQPGWRENKMQTPS